MLHVLQSRHRDGDGLSGLHQHIRELLRRRGHLGELIEHQRGGGRLDVVHDVVHPRDQAVDVIAVERRDERLVQALHARVGDDVGLVFDFFDARRQGAHVLTALHQPLHFLCSLDRERGVALEEAEEILVAREETAQHVETL
jgi:hypothetical protein